MDSNPKKRIRAHHYCSACLAERKKQPRRVFQQTARRAPNLKVKVVVMSRTLRIETRQVHVLRRPKPPARCHTLKKHTIVLQ